MSFADQYLARQNISGRIESSPHPDLRYTVVIPCFDEPDLIVTLDSLRNCNMPEFPVEVIVMVNSSSDSGDEVRENNLKTISEVREWVSINRDPVFRIHILHDPDFPVKYAGPGLARKTGMDEAVCRFNRLDRPDGVILSMDADCTVERNYFVEVERQVVRKPGTKGFAIYFEHPLTGNSGGSGSGRSTLSDREYSPAVYRAIADYELHLRYYIQAIRSTGFPHAFHTVGSCFGVTAQTYVKQGGMNKRKGGEDFYFLQKTIPPGDFYEINTTCVYPSPRPSHRVPFGTGPIVRKHMVTAEELLTYHPGSFHALRELFSGISRLYQATSREKEIIPASLPPHLVEFLRDDFLEKIAEINANSASESTFLKRFYHWFNMFKILKYLNFAHDGYFEKQPVSHSARVLLRDTGILRSTLPRGKPDRSELLAVYRKIQRQNLPQALVD